MENKNTTLLGFLGQVFMIYGITNIVLNIFTAVFGASAEGYSSIFSLGSKGVASATCVQFLGAVALLTALNAAFSSSKAARALPSAARIALLFVCALIITIVLNLFFGWFPSDNAAAWVMFIICFAISCAASIAVSVISARQQNQKLEQALARLKEEDENE